MFKFKEEEMKEYAVYKPMILAVCEPMSRIKTDVSHKRRTLNVISEAKAIQAKARKLKESGIAHDDHLIIFLHGYNNTELDMNKRAAEIDLKLGTTNIITTAFDWPSYCSLFTYGMDQKTVEICATLFVTYLEEIRKAEIHKFKQIDIVAHSMGNYLLTQAIKSCNPQIFFGCNVICVAADSPYNEYSDAVNVLHNIVSSWTHYWTNADCIFVNWKKRAGQCACKYNGKYSNILSIEWTKHKLISSNHGYIDDILGKDDKLAADVIKRLHIEDDKEIEDDDKVNDFKKYSELWDKVYIDGNDISYQYIDRMFWKDKYGCKYSDDKYGVFKVQHNTWNHQYRIIYCRNKTDNQWKVMLDSKNLNNILDQYGEYIAMLKWKNKTQ